MLQPVQPTLAADGIHVPGPGNTASTLPFYWLRDNCRCAACRHPGNGQKLYEITDLPPDLRAREASIDGNGNLLVQWSDGHASRFDAPWLAGHGLDDASRAQRRGKVRLWDKRLANELPAGDWPAMLADPAVELAWLEGYTALGFGLLRQVPCQSGMVAEVGDRLGHVRVTNYGRLFDVKSVPNPNNLADTALGLGVHSDNPYRDPSPGIQLLHCLESEAPGGDTLLVDGFHAAGLLRAEDPGAFELLASVPMDFRYANADTELRARQTLISVDSDGQVCAVHFNNRSADWLDASPAVARRWYAAYMVFARILKRPELELIFRLAPGDCVVMRNDRTLHGRTAFDPNLGRRHLQGCYIDRDGVESRRLVLRRTLADHDAPRA
jgi:gamma-butyrobetaine dioxygenase